MYYDIDAKFTAADQAQWKKWDQASESEKTIVKAATLTTKRLAAKAAREALVGHVDEFYIRQLERAICEGATRA